MKTFDCRNYGTKGMGVRGCIKRQFAKSFGEGGPAWRAGYELCRSCNQGRKIAIKYPEYVPEGKRPAIKKNKTCPVCNDPFPSLVKAQKHCTKECANVALSLQRKGITKTQELYA